MKIRVNMKLWHKRTKAARAKIQSTANEYVRKKMWAIYMEAVRVSPQWSGDYAVNWQIEYSGSAAGANRIYNSGFKKNPWRKLKNPKQAGDLANIAAAIRQEKEMLENLKWNHKVRLVNPAPVAREIEVGNVNFRAVNRRPYNVIDTNYGVVAHLRVKFGKWLK